MTPWLLLQAAAAAPPRPPEGLTGPLHDLLSHALIKASLPGPILLLLAPVVYWFFRDTWFELDVEAQRERGALLAAGRIDRRVPVALVIVALVLTVQEYYGGHGTYRREIVPWLEARQQAGATWVNLEKYGELYDFIWWALVRVVGYAVVPIPLWKLFFPGDRIVDLGLRARGFSRHVPMYLLCLAVVLPTMLIVSRQPDFGTYYPFYKQSGRSWFDLIVWETMYFAQFLSLEFFFRGWMLGAMRRSLGSGAIFVMAVPYCMIHYGKPFLEANGAIVAGIVLGSLAMKTRSIYAGFLVHITVALLMDLLALAHRDALPHQLFP